MAALSELTFAAFLVFCRIGCCFLFAPGLSSARIPMQVRLLVAAAAALALSPWLVNSIAGDLTGSSPEARIVAIASEILTGSAIGMVGRIFILAVQFAATTISNTIGLAGIPGVALDDMESGSPLATLASSTAVMLLLTMNLHIEMLHALMDSYKVIPVAHGLNPAWLLDSLVTAPAETSVLALRLAAPFIAYGVVVNVAVGLANRFAPQVTVYYATTGVTMLGGLALLWLMVPEWFASFAAAYQDWLSKGGF